jgi:hypothetical protein
VKEGLPDKADASGSRPWIAQMKRVCQLFLLAFLTSLSAQHLQAQNTQSQWWPELDTYLRLNKKTRLSLFAKRSTDGSNYDSVSMGPNLDFYLKPLRKRVRSNDATKDRYLVFRIGYRYFANADGASENRGIVQITNRVPLPWSLLLSDRNRADLRWVSGNAFRWRYRNRLTLERSFRIGRVGFTPYLRGEIYYVSRSGDWSKNSYSLGAEIPLGRRMQAEPYFEHDNQSRTAPQHVNALGLKFSLYF